jgi:hypothetical protein
MAEPKEDGPVRNININLRSLIPHRSRRWLAIPIVTLCAGIVPENGSVLSLITMSLGSLYLAFLITCFWQGWIPRLVRSTFLPLLISAVRVFSTWMAYRENLWSVVLQGHYPTLFLLLLPLFACSGLVVGIAWNEASRGKVGGQASD